MGGTYLAICLFGFIFAVRPLNEAEYNHERIHAAQQRELLYLPFFLWYVAEWLVLLLKYRDSIQYAPLPACGSVRRMMPIARNAPITVKSIPEKI